MVGGEPAGKRGGREALEKGRKKIKLCLDGWFKIVRCVGNTSVESLIQGRWVTVGEACLLRGKRL